MILSVQYRQHRKKPMKRKHLECACCGGDAGLFAQFFNQDTGYGVCKSCVSWIQGRGMSQADFERTYGKPGINYEASDVKEKS